MNIKDIRIKAKINEIIKDHLVNGYVPTSHEVIAQITGYMRDNNLNLPNYAFEKVKLLSADNMNNTNQNVYKDMQIIYNALIQLYLESDSQINKFDIQKKQQSKYIDYLQSQLESLVHKYTYNKESYIENFVNMNMLNMSETTANINIEQQIATLNKYRDIIYKDFDITISNASIETNGTMKQMLSTKGLVWRGIIKSAEDNGAILTFIIDLKKEVEVNRIEFSMPLIKPSVLRVESSVDKHVWTTAMETTISEKKTVHILKPTRYLKVTIDKNEADKFTASSFSPVSQYEYHFLVDTIAMFTSKYEEASQIVSKEISTDPNISHVGIYPTQTIPPATSVKYYIATNDSENWISIPTNTTIFLSNVIENQRARIELDKTLNNYLLQHQSINTQNLYGIYNIPSGITLKTHELYKGIYSWKVRTSATTSSDPQNSSIFSGPYTHTAVNAIKPSLILNEDITTAVTREYSICLEREAAGQAVTAMLSTTQPISIYLNGSLLYKGTTAKQISYPLKQGQNMFVIVIGCTVGTNTVDLNLPLEKYSTRMLAYQDPLKFVSLFDLKHNTNNKNNVYTIYNDQVIVKGLDTTLVYDLDFSKLKEEIDSIKIKAEMTRLYDETNKTPEIHRIELRCS